MQRGYLYQYSGAWYLRFYERTATGRKQSCKRLGAVADHPKKTDARLLADKFLLPHNLKKASPESQTPVVQFIEGVYLPHVQKTLRASTYKDYEKDVFKKHLKKRLGDLRIGNFRTVDGQRIISDIADSTQVGHKTQLRIKSFLSGVFKYAKQLGYTDGENPMRDVKCFGKTKKFKGSTCSTIEIEEMLISLPEPARTIVGLAALTGLRHSEIRGLRWSDYSLRNGTLTVNRAVWRTHVQDPKTDSSENSVPVLPLLQRALESHKKRVKPKSAEEYIFAGSRYGRPLNLANLVRRVIVPAFEKKKTETKGAIAPVWKGWHSFRRGLATNLYALGIQPKVISAILRHSDIGVTLEYYTQTDDNAARDALQEIENCFPFGL